jgi:hypothetical protein
MRAAVAIAILAALPLSAALADVYRSVDAQGHVLYSDTPTPGATLVRVTSSQQFRAAPSDVSSNPKPASPPPKVADSADADLARDAAARSVHTEVAQNRAALCKKAQDLYQQLIQARRVYTGESNGERQYLSDADADQARVNAKLQMDDACKDQPAAQAAQ